MKKIYLFIALMAMTATASAQVMGEGNEFLCNSGITDLCIIPKQFTYDGKPLLSSDVDGVIYVYNGDIEKVREFVGPRYENVTIQQELNTETNEWVTTDKYSHSYSALANMELVDVDDNSYSCLDGDYSLSQTLFNTDEKFEYIRLDYDETESISEYDFDYDEVIDHRNIFIDRVPVGFSIVQDDGTVLQSVNGNFSEKMMIIKIDGKIYLVAEKEKEIGNNKDMDYLVFFLIDRKVNSIKQVNTLPGLKVRPSVADRNQQVTVDLEGDACEIQIVNTAGQTIKRIPVGKGQRQVIFNTRGLNSGVNMVHARGRGTDVTRKFIVK